jgi:hypothetical protein
LQTQCLAVKLSCSTGVQTTSHYDPPRGHTCVTRTVRTACQVPHHVHRRMALAGRDLPPVQGALAYMTHTCIHTCILVSLYICILVYSHTYMQGALAAFVRLCAPGGELPVQSYLPRRFLHPFSACVACFRACPSSLPARTTSCPRARGFSGLCHVVARAPIAHPSPPPRPLPPPLPTEPPRRLSATQRQLLPSPLPPPLPQQQQQLTAARARHRGR